MNLSAPFIKRPIATTLLAFGIAIAGIMAFKFLPVSSLPQVDFPTINVSASLPGASPDTMATSVATPLERQLGRIAGVTQLTSTSTLGSTNISIQFDLSRDINGAAREVQAAINAARSQLPANLPSNPTYRKVNPADPPIIILDLTSNYYTRGQMYDIASTILQQKLSQIEGVGQVYVAGGSLPGVRVELNPTTLNKYGIGLEQVRTVLASANVNRPTGQLISADKFSNIKTTDQLFTADVYKPLIIAYRNGNPVRLGDVANVINSVENIRNAGIANGKPAIALVLFKEPGANAIATVDRVKAILPILRAQIPATIDIEVAIDRTSTIRASLHDVELTLFISILLVTFVVYLFLAEGRAAFIASVAVPLSLLGTFGVIYLSGFSLNNLSLMALTISTGFVIDDAVVVLENTMRHIEEGLAPKIAALKGATEVGFTVLSMSISLVAVFIPILFMGGIVGRLFREFAVTLAVAILMSLIISLTVTPMMCAYLLQKKAIEKPQSLKARWGKLLEIVRNYYQHSLNWALDNTAWMLGITFSAIVLSILLFMLIPRGFFPQQDTGRITGSIQAQQDISFIALQKRLEQFVTIVRQDPAVQNVVGYVSGTSGGNMFIALKPLSQRHVSADDVINRLRAPLNTVPGAALYLQSAQDLTIGGRQSNAQFQYTLSADSISELDKWAPIVMARLSKLPGIADVNSDQRSNGLEEFITYDHDSAARFGINSRLIDNTLYDAFGQRQVSVMYTLMNQYHVVMELAPQFWQSPAALENIYVTTVAGNQVPLSAIASFASGRTLLAVNHQDQFPSATLSFNLLPGTALSDAIKEVTNAVANMNLPHTIRGSFQGSAKAFRDSLASQPYLILIALVAVYIVLGILYESLIHPITIISTLPSAGVGALLALLATNTQFTIIALIGLILLIGIVKKNAIMMIDFAIVAKRNENVSSHEAIYQAALLRFRPIMMTTAAALFGAFPLALGFGLGAELRRPLGIAIIGGLIVSQMLTLYTTPVIYLSFEKLSEKTKRFFAKRYNRNLPINDNN